MILLFIWAISNFLEDQMDNTADNCRSRNPDQRQYASLFQHLFLNDAVPEEHKSGIDMGRDLLRRSHVLVVCGHTVTEAMKNDIAVAQRLGITATTLEGILTVKGQGRR